MIRTRLAAIILAACVCLPLSPAAQTDQKPTMAGYPAIGAPAITKIITPGAAPRRAVRYTVPVGYKGSMNMTTTMEIGGAMAMPPMGMEMGLNVGVSAVAPNGDITMTMLFTKAGLSPGADPAIAAALQGALGQIVGMKGTTVMSNRGVAKSVKMDLDNIKDPAMSQAFSQVSQQLENMVAPFPEEAIGVGAKWEVRQAMENQGLFLFQRAEYEVTAMTPTSLSLNIKLEQTAPPQSVSNPQLPQGTQMMLERMTTSGAGTGTIPTNSLVPTMGLDMNMSMAMSVNMSGTSLPVAVDMKMKMTIAPAASK